VDIAIASTLAIRGIAMTPLPYSLVGGALAAAVIFSLILDLVKIPVFAHLCADPGATERKLELKVATPTDSAARIADRAYELYEQGGHKEGAAVQNWLLAEAQIRGEAANAAPRRVER
jgi:hypothetical protein